MHKFTAFLVAIVAVAGLQLNVCAQSVSGADCRNECLKCAATCDDTLSRCRMMKGSHTTAGHIKTIQDCASLCRQSASFIDRGSALSGKLCVLCAEACTNCAESCEAFKGDKAMQSCAQQCRTCAQACRKMTG